MHTVICDLLDVGLHVYLCVSYVYGVCIMPPVSHGCIRSTKGVAMGC